MSFVRVNLSRPQKSRLFVSQMACGNSFMCGEVKQGETTNVRQKSRHLQNILIHQRILKKQSVRRWSSGCVPESTHLRGGPIAFPKDLV